MCTSPSAWGLTPQPNFLKKGVDLTGPQLLVGGCWEREGDVFQGVLQFSQKQKIKI